MKKNGFTLTELLVITAIISLMSTLILANYRAGERQFSLVSSSHKLAQDLRRSQEKTMSMRKFNCPAGKLKGYGIRFQQGSESYHLNARCDIDGVFQDSSLEEVLLEPGVQIKEIKRDTVQVSAIDVFFYPPDPQTDLEGGNKVTVSLCLEEDIEITQTISINKSGLISLE